MGNTASAHRRIGPKSDWARIDIEFSKEGRIYRTRADDLFDSLGFGSYGIRASISKVWFYSPD